MEKLELILPFYDFKITTEKFIALLDDLCDQNKSYENEEQSNHFKILFQRVSNEINEHLKKSFNIERNYFYMTFEEAGMNQFYIPGNYLALESIHQRLIEKVKERAKALKYIISVLEVCDQILGKLSSDLIIERENFTIRKKQDFLLKRLSNLKDEYNYPVDILFLGNGIKEDFYKEFEKIYYDLDKNQFITGSFTSNKMLANLTLKGRKYVQDVLEKENNYLISILQTKNRVVKSSFSGSKEIKAYFKRLISKDLEASFNDLDNFIIENTNSWTNLTLQRGRYNRIKEKQDKAIISNEDVSIEINRIHKSLLNLVDDLTDKDIKKELKDIFNPSSNG
jgi:hypothetical protein